MRDRSTRSLFLCAALYVVAALLSLPALANAESLPDPACAYRLLHSFGQPGPGAFPRATLLRGSDGALYGTAQRGGTNDYGTVFKVNPDGTGFQVLVHFDRDTNGAYPWAGLIQASDGVLYGTATMGGAHGLGTAFKVNIDGTGFTVIKSFSGADTGSMPYATLLQGADGALYGTASEGGTNGTGTIFKMNGDGTGFVILKNFSGVTTGGYSYSELIQAPDGTLYGTASAGGAANSGTVFKINPDGTGFAIIKSFDGGAGGTYPWGALLLASNGSLYGTTTSGGATGDGTLFRVNTDGSGFAILKQFVFAQTGTFPATALIEGAGGVLFGTTSDGGGAHGTVFKINLNGTGFAILKLAITDNPVVTDRMGGVILGAEGALYGTTPEDSLKTGGTVYRVNTDGTNSVTIFQGFSPFPDRSNGGGYLSSGLLRATDGALYGVTGSGGPSGGGTVFRLQPDGSGFTVLKNMDAATGIGPSGDLIQATNGALYGTAGGGGSLNAGTLFRLNLDGSGFSVVLNFDGANMGATPNTVIQGIDRKLYGTAFQGGVNGRGTVFRVDDDGSNFAVIQHLGLVNAGQPIPGLIQGTDGQLYGVSHETAHGGNVFRLSPVGTGFTPLQAVSGSSGLTEGPNDFLYGVSSAVSAGVGGGFVYRMHHDGTGYSVLHQFNRDGSGEAPFGELLVGADGKLYGTTERGGSDDAGILFRLNADGTNYELMVNFQRASMGADPRGRLIQTADGLIYGTHLEGGTVGAGVVFRYDLFIDQTPPVAHCKNVTVPSTSACTAQASIDDGSFDPDAGDRIELSQEPAGPFPVGDTRVSLSVTDRGCLTRTCTATVTVLPGTTCDDGNACTTSDHCEAPGCVGGAPLNCDDGNCCTVDSCNPASGCAHAPYVTPPTIVAQPDLDGGGGSCPALWPPNHHYVDFGVAATGIEAVSTCGGITYAFASCNSSQAEDQAGGSDGSTVRDCVYEPGALHLRAERDGTCSPKGRSYTMTMIATDACGNAVTSSPFTVCVWHDKRSGPGNSGGNIYSATGGSDSRPGTNGTYGDACGAGCGLVCGEGGQTHDSSDDDRPTLTLTPLAGGSVRLDWSLPAPGDPYPPNADYEVWRRVRGQTLYEKLTELPHTANTYTDAALADGVDYEWSVNALY